MEDNDIVGGKNAKALDFRRMLADKHDFFEQAENYALLGASESEMAAFFHITRDLWLYYVKHSQELRDALDRGGVMADAKVAKAMHRRATGYDYTRQRILVSKEGSATIYDIVEHLPPDTSAGKFWLTNREPRKWSERQERIPGLLSEGADQEITITFVNQKPLLNISPPSHEVEDVGT